MLAFQRALLRWEPYIKKNAYARAVKLNLSESNDLTVTVYWTDRKGVSGQYQKVITRSDVYTRIGAGLQPRPSKTVCRFADEIIAEVLKARGV